MTAWQILKSKSALLTGTAWQHLNNLTGGEIVEYTFAIDAGLTMTEQTETITIKDTDNITLSVNDDTITLTEITSSEYLTAQDSTQDLTTNG